jgi:hypothetical protein
MNRTIHSPLFGEVIVPVGAGMFVFGLGGSRSLITWGVAWIFAGGFIAFFGWCRRRATRIAQSGRPVMSGLRISHHRTRRILSTQAKGSHP